MGYCGACRRDELRNMSVGDVELKSDIVTVMIPKTKNKVPRLFLVSEAFWIALIRKYVQLRPAHTPHNRFFVTYRAGKCTTSPIGINKIGAVPKEIAKFLKLPHPELYTGHCFRRSSATHLANQGGDLLTIKKHGGWKSSNVAEGYVDASMGKKVEVAKMFSNQSLQSGASTSVAVNLNEGSNQVLQNIHIQDRVGVNNATENRATKDDAPHKQESNLLDTATQSLPGISVTASNSATVSIKIYTHCTVRDE